MKKLYALALFSLLSLSARAGRVDIKCPEPIGRIFLTRAMRPVVEVKEGYYQITYIDFSAQPPALAVLYVPMNTCVVSWSD